VGRREPRPKGLLDGLYELVDIEVAQHGAQHVVVRKRVKRDVDSAFPAHDVVRHRAGRGWVQQVQQVLLSDLDDAAVGGALGRHSLERGCGPARKEEPRSLESERPRFGAPTEPAAPPGHRHRVVELHLRPPSARTVRGLAGSRFRGCPTTTEAVATARRWRKTLFGSQNNVTLLDVQRYRTGAIASIPL
jgi:hypothetical protein